MARLSINEMTTYRWAFEDDVHHYAAAQIPAIGIWRQKLADFGEEKGVELLSESGLHVSSLLWAGGFTGSDGRSYKESVADGRIAIRTAAALHAPNLIVYSGARGGHTQNHARRLLTNALRELLPIACEFGVTLALEPMPAACATEWTFLHSIEAALELLDEVDSPNVKLVFDTYHFGQDAAIFECLPTIAARIAIVQLADAKQPPHGDQNRCLLGDGMIPLGDIIARLIRGGYQGEFEVKLMGEAIETTDYHEVIARSQQAFERLTAAASPA